MNCVCVHARVYYFAVHSTSTACALRWYIFQARFRPGRWGSHSPGIETKPMYGLEGVGCNVHFCAHLRKTHSLA